MPIAVQFFNNTVFVRFHVEWSVVVKEERLGMFCEYRSTQPTVCLGYCIRSIPTTSNLGYFYLRKSVKSAAVSTFRTEVH